HPDHVGGNADVHARYPDAAVYGHRSDERRIPAISKLLDDGDRFRIGTLEVTTRHVPGHTLGAVTYVVRDDSPPEQPGDRAAEDSWAFTGDTMFLAGCGRLFEGTPAQMHRSLNDILAKLDPSTKIGCGHEYTQSNLRFAQHVE